ncbi:hypothetical protein K3495_g10462 [Podosphaera aphanis]|nr:hypothetical protein K3495_g10462 [Podosphaera aphanis]
MRLHKYVVKTLIPRTKPSEFAKPYWTKECSEAVKQARKARRYWTQFKTEGSWIEYQKATNNKKKAKKDSEERNRLPQVPDIQDKEGNVWIEDTDKARVMAQHFFPQPVQAEIQDIAGTIYPEELAIIPSTITEAEVEEAIGKLPSDKAPGPDEIPNRLLKECRKTLSKALVELFNGCLSLGYHPTRFKESTTIVLRKPQKPRYDTPKAYRPIALLNTMGKLLEKLIAKRISRTAETHHLLPEEQMGARPNRSTVTAIEMLTEQIQTTWGRNKKRVTSLLSLDISGAFDNVSHQRLIHNLRLKGIPKWITRFIASFLEGRITSVVLNSFKSEQIPTCTGIPQGSSLSPILFLSFASTLLPLLQTPSSSAVGFVDDTNIITWSETTEENCRQLAQLREVCLLWARRHGVKFAPEKYQLLHFSRAKKRHNLQTPIHIQGHKIKPQESIRILGIHMDPKLNWKAHVNSIKLRAESQVRVMSRLTQSTLGATFVKAKLLYSILVRPTLTYGSPIWAQAGPKGQIPNRIISPLRSTQRRCLKLITGAYKSTSNRMLEHETSTLPIEIYLKERRVQYAGLSRNLPAQLAIKAACRKIKRSDNESDDARVLMRQEDMALWLRICEGVDTQRQQNEACKRAAFQEWAHSWGRQRQNQRAGYQAAADPIIWRAANLNLEKRPADLK